MIPWFVRLPWWAQGLILLAAVIVAVSGWTAGASYLLIKLLRVESYFSFREIGTYSIWWDYLGDTAQPASVNKWLALSAALPTIVLAAPLVRSFLDYRRRRLTRPFGGGLRRINIGVTDNLGHAAFASRDQLMRQFANKDGCLFGATDRTPAAKLLFDDVNQGPGHSMVFAGPGAHKTATAISRIWAWNGPRVVFDPSCEIGPMMADALRETRGCNVFTIGLGGNGLNALDWIDTSHPEADVHIRSAVDWIYNEDATGRSGPGQARDPFFATQGRALVTCLAAALVYGQDAPRTLKALRRGISIPEFEMPNVLRGIHAGSRSGMARDLAGSLMGMRARETFSSIYANATSATEWLSVGPYADVVSGNAMETSAILQSNTVVFVQIPLRTLLVTPAVGRAVIGALFNAIFQADGLGIDRRILFEIDETWVLGRMKEIMLGHATARKYLGAINTIWQSEKQLEEVWGREGAGALRDMLAWRSYNAISDGDVAERLSKDLGSHGVLAYSEGVNDGRQKPWGLAMPSSSRGSQTNTHEIKRSLVSRDEILRSPADMLYVLPRDYRMPIRCCTAPYFRFPWIANRLKSNRFAKAS